jgi:hypothetical protein
MKVSGLTITKDPCQSNNRASAIIASRPAAEILRGLTLRS